MPDDFVAVVLAIEGVASFVGDRVFPNRLPVQVWDSDDPRPCLCYFASTDQPQRTSCGADDLVLEHFTFHAAAASYNVARAIGDALSAGAVGFRGVSGSTRFEPVFLEAEFDGEPEPEPGCYIRTVQLGCWRRST